jgi:hypothetical protein
MKLSKTTIEILKNFSTINCNLAIKPGQRITTISEASDIFAAADIEETFDHEFGIYDLPDFLGVHNLLNEPELSFTDSSVVLSSGRSRANYRYADINILTTPKKEIKMPEIKLALNLSSDTISTLRRASSALGVGVLAISSDGEEISLVVCDTKNSGANTFTTVLDEKNTSGREFNILIDVANLKLIPGSYTLNLTWAPISQWVHESGAVTYYVALKKESTFGS